MANVGEQLLQPESGMKRIDDTFYAIKYNGSSWTHFSNNDTNYNNGTGHSNNKKGEYYEIYCYTSKFNIIANYADNLSNDVDIFINSEKENFSQYNSSTNTKICVFKKYFENKQLIHLKVVNKTNNYINIDAIDIDEDGYMIYCDDNGKLYYDVTPIMTSNTTPEGYEASAASNSQSLDPYMAFDGRIRSNDTYFYCTASKALTNQWLKLLSNSKIRISTILLISQIGAFPKKVNIQGSNDNKNFTDLNAIDIDNTKTDVLIDLDNVCEYKTYRVQMNGSYHPNYIYIHELRYLLAVDTPFYLINDNGVYKNYDEETNSLVEVEDTSILNENSLNNTCIYDLNKVSSLIDLKQSGVKILSNKNFKSKIKVLKTTKQLFFANGDFSTRVANNIDYFKFNYDIPESTIIKTVVSTNSGTAWYTCIDGAWTRLDNIIPIKDYSELSSEEKIQWNTFLDEVLTKGINIQEVNTLDFNTLNSEKIRFAYAIQISDANAEAILKDLKWQFDSIGSYEQMSPKTDVNIKITNNEISIQPLKDVELMKINVGISSQVPQVFDTSGLMDKSTFKGKYEDSVKKADSIYVPDDVVLNSDYGIDINGNLGYHPRIPIPNEITSYIFPMLTKDIQQSLSIESEGINYMVQCYAKQPDLTNVEEVFESYANPIVTNHSNNVETVEDNGFKITQIKNNNIYKSTNSETGFHEFAIDFSKYIYLNSIEEVDNDE